MRAAVVGAGAVGVRAARQLLFLGVVDSLAVVDPNLQPVAEGDVGELIIGGVGLARYLDPVKDAEKYAAMPTLGWDRAYRSGDLVRLESHGLFFVGRADDQVKVGGRRIELGEVDSALVNLPGVSGGAAAVRRTASGTPLLVGYIASADPNFDLAAAREQLGAASERLRLAEQELAQARDRFSAGVASNADVVNASLALTLSQTFLNNAEASYQLARVSLARATGSVTTLR